NGVDLVYVKIRPIDRLLEVYLGARNYVGSRLRHSNPGFVQVMQESARSRDVMPDDQDMCAQRQSVALNILKGAVHRLRVPADREGCPTVFVIARGILLFCRQASSRCTNIVSEAGQAVG